MIQGGSEDPKTDIPDRKYDLVFTSPPYFDLEIFGEGDVEGSKSQSTVKFSGEQMWFDGFLKVALQRSWDLLIPGGHLVLNINQADKTQKYMGWILGFMKTVSDAEYLGVLSYSNKKFRNPQPMWIWKKKGTAGADN